MFNPQECWHSSRPAYQQSGWLNVWTFKGQAIPVTEWRDGWIVRRQGSQAVKGREDWHAGGQGEEETLSNDPTELADDQKT